MVSAAKLAYRPVGLIASVVAGAIASAVFKQIWKRVSDEDDAPDAMQSEYGIGQILLAAMLQGAIFAVVKAAVDRDGASGVRRTTGRWPG